MKKNSYEKLARLLKKNRINNINRNYFSIFTLNYKHKDVTSTININDNTTFEELEKELKKFRLFENIQFKSWDDCLISNKNSISSSIQKDLIFLRFNKEEWKELYKSNENTLEIREIDLKANDSIKSNTSNSNLQNDLCKKIYLLENNLAQNYSLDLILKYTGKGKDNILNELFLKEKEYSKLLQENEKYTNKAKTKAKLIIALGGILFIAELLLLYYGTFIEFSWDVTEPMTYLVTCLNFLLILLFHKKFKGSSAHSYFTNKFLAKSFGKSKLENLKKMQEEIEFIKKQIKV